MSEPLSVNVFTAPEKPVVGERPRPFGPPMSWDPITATLVYGEHDAVLVDTLTTVAEATALANWIALHNRNLTTIYCTHGHFDHFFGLSVLLEHFPAARAIATPKSVELMEEMRDDRLRFFRQSWPGQIPARIVTAEPYADSTFELEGHELHIIEQGRTDTIDTTSLHVPAIDLVIGGDVLYNECHMYVGGTTHESRLNWISALDRLAALQPRMAVAGHKKTGAPDTPDAIAASRQYLVDFDTLSETTTSDRELYDEMTKRYPSWVSHQAWLMFNLNTDSLVRE
jgi:glyoxylase-like metal-dependent hydrolase (beta-lactamase superfamily II)